MSMFKKRLRSAASAGNSPVSASSSTGGGFISSGGEFNGSSSNSNLLSPQQQQHHGLSFPNNKSSNSGLNNSSIHKQHALKPQSYHYHHHQTATSSVSGLVGDSNHAVGGGSTTTTATSNNTIPASSSSSSSSSALTASIASSRPPRSSSSSKPIPIRSPRNTATTTTSSSSHYHHNRHQIVPSPQSAPLTSPRSGGIGPSSSSSALLGGGGGSSVGENGGGTSYSLPGTDETNPFYDPKSDASKLLTPIKRRASGTADRFIPSRSGDLSSTYALLNEYASPKLKRKANAEPDVSKEQGDRTYQQVLRNELFPNMASSFEEDSRAAQVSRNLVPSTPTKSPKHSIFNFKSPTKSPFPQSSVPDSPTFERYSVTPLGIESQRLLQSPRKAPRHISKAPYKVLDAPDLQDDFYLNLVDWGAANILSVGLGTCVYLWSAHTSKVTKLCDLADTSDSVTSVNWNSKGNLLSVGTNRGFVQLYDVQASKMIRQFGGHQARVGALAWSSELLTSGSRDRLIYHRDHRSSDDWVKKLVGHKQEVCGLKWNPESTQLASGGNDNKLFVWDKAADTPTLKFSDHTAAVKAIAWSPHQHGLLASGGGTADRHIRFWSTINGTAISAHDTGSQVCNLYWSKTSNELVSTHGYSQNQIVIWKYPSMQQLATLTGHTLRVLYLAMSPDGQNIVTGAGDETLRFWNVFNKGRNSREDRGLMTHSLSIR